MRDILFLAHRIPFPPDRGDKIRSWHLLKALGQLGRVHLACFADDEADAAHLPALREAMGGGARRGACRGPADVGKAAAGARALLEGKPVVADPVRQRGACAPSSIGCWPAAAIGTSSLSPARWRSSSPSGSRQRFVMDFGDVDSAKFGQYADEGAGRCAGSTGARRGCCSPSSAPPRRAPTSATSSARPKRACSGRSTGLARHPRALRTASISTISIRRPISRR